MIKSLLFTAALCAATGAMAMAPLTVDQLEKFRIQINTQGEDKAFSKSAAVSLEYSDASNPDAVNIQNFNGEALPLRLNTNWEDGTISAAPYTFSSDMDYDTYETYYLMVVDNSVADLASPMDPAFNASKVKGTITEELVTLDNWNIVKVSQNFQSMTKVYEEAQNTVIRIPNANISVTLLDWDEEWENLLPGETMEYGIYTEATNDSFTVYNWDDMASCVKFHPVVNEGVTTYVTDADQIIYNDGRRHFGIYPLPGLTWDEVDSVSEPVSFNSLPITNVREVEFGKWIIKALNRNTDRLTGESAKITLDYDLPLLIVGVDDVKAEGKVESVRYYNLQGVEIERPAKGLYIQVQNFADGTSKTVKTVR